VDPKLTSFAAPEGRSVRYGRPGARTACPKLTSLAAPGGRSVRYGRPGAN